MDPNTYRLLERIATALETLAADATDRRVVARVSLASQRAHLEHVLRQKQQAFSLADDAAAHRNVQDGTWSADDREWHRRTEREMYAAQEALDAFAAAHPGVLLTTARACPTCDGDKTINAGFETDDVRVCPDCNGSGYAALAVAR